MATKIFPVDLASDNPAAGSPNRGLNNTDLRGNAVGWSPQGIRTTVGSGANSQSGNTITGPTAGIEIGGNSAATAAPVEWVTEPLAAGVTISGTITFNIWGLESVMTNNAGLQVVVERLDNTGAIVSTVVNSEFGTELGTAFSANNWTAAPTSTSFNKGDRIRVRICANDAGGTMVAVGNGWSISTGSATGGTQGDSWVQFTETITFLQSDPAGSQLFCTSTAAGISPGGTALEAWTSRGGGSVNSVTNTATGWVAPIQVTDTGGGTVLGWYSKPLVAFTLAGMVKMNARGLASNVTIGVVWRGEVALCASNGTLVSVWAAGGATGQVLTSDASYALYVAGQDLAVSDGQRLRFRFFIDDSSIAMVTGNTATLSYNGTSGGAAGDSFVILPQTVTAQTSAFFAQGRQLRGDPTSLQVIGQAVNRSVFCLGDKWARHKGKLWVPRREIALPA